MCTMRTSVVILLKHCDIWMVMNGTTWLFRMSVMYRLCNVRGCQPTPSHRFRPSGLLDERTVSVSLARMTIRAITAICSIKTKASFKLCLNMSGKELKMWKKNDNSSPTRIIKLPMQWTHYLNVCNTVLRYALL